MFTKGLALTLRPGCYDEYKRAHDELWPDLAQGMEDNNISMIIYRTGEQLIIFGSAPTEEEWNRSRVLPIIDKWHDYMATLLETDVDGNIVFQELAEAFSFGMFAK